MTLALASRGYLCFGKRGEVPPFGPGPKIIGINEVKPGIDVAAVMKAEAPSITGAGVKGPQIVKATNPTPPPGGPTPVIVGAGVLSPGIDSSKEK